MNEEDELHVFESECDWIVAKSVDDAWDIWCEMTGEKREDYKDEQEFEQIPDDRWLTFIDTEAVCGVFEWGVIYKLKRPRIPYYELRTRRLHDGHNYLRVRAQCSDWCQANGRGILGTVEW